MTLEDVQGSFAESAARKAFLRKPRRDRAKETVQKSSLQTAGEQLGEVQRQANEARVTGNGPSMTQTRQQTEGTLEQFMAAWDTQKHGAPTGGQVNDPERESVRREAEALIDPNTNKFSPGALGALKSRLESAKAKGRYVTIDDMRGVTGQDIDPLDEAATMAAQTLKSTRDVPMQMGGAAASSLFQEPLGSDHPLTKGSEFVGQMLGGAVSGAGELGGAVSMAEGAAESPEKGFQETLFNLGPMILQFVWRGGKAFFKNRREAFDAFKEAHPSANVDEQLFNQVLDRRQEILDNQVKPLEPVQLPPVPDHPVKAKEPPAPEQAPVVTERPQEGAVSISEAPKGQTFKAYHGTPDIRNFDSFASNVEQYRRNFDPSFNDPDRAFWFSSDERVAKTYADDRRAFDYQNAEPAVIPGNIRLENPLVIDAKGQRWTGTRDAVARAKEAGHDGVIINNVIDDYNTTSKSKPTTTYAVFDPAQIERLDKPKQTPEPVQSVNEPKPVEVAEPVARQVEQPTKPSDTGVSENPRATGLANQVQSREAEASILKDVEATKGKSAEEWQKIGKQKVETEGADFHQLARQVANGEVELTGERVGVLLEGKRQLLDAVNRAKSALDASPGDKTLQADLETKQTILDDYVSDVQAGKGRWSDVGRALQAGTQLDTGDYAQVIQHLKRKGVTVDEATQAKLKEAADEIAGLRKEIDNLKANPNEYTAQQAIQRVAPRTRRFDRAGAQKRIDENLKKLSELKPTSGVGSNKQRGAASITVDDLKLKRDQLLLVKDISLDWARIHIGANLEDVVLGVQNVFRAQGYEIDRDAIVHALSEHELGHSVSEATDTVNRVKSEAGTEARIAEKEANLGAKRSFGVVRRAPREKTVSQHIEDLQAREKLLDSRLRNKLREQETPKAKRFLRGVTDTVRGTILGSDLGVMLRQGLFTSVSRPKTFLRSVGKGAKVMLSEENLAKWANEVETKRYSDGTLASKVKKEAGLSTTDALNSHEEAVLGRWLRKVPGFGKIAGGAERFQTVFINNIRNELFDLAYEKGLSAADLKARARFINSATGRGNVKQVPEFLQATMTSPRYEKSRWEMIGEYLRNPVEALNNKGARENLKDLAVTTASIYALYKTAELAGYKVDLDPKSGDFLKMRLGNEVWDVSAGMAPRIRDVLRIVLGAKKLAETGKLEYGADPARALGASLLRTASPVVKTTADQSLIAAQRHNGVDKPKGYLGIFEEGDSEGLWAFAPLIAQTFWQTLKGSENTVDDPGAAVQGLAKEFVGTSVNRYPRKEGAPAVPDLPGPDMAPVRRLFQR